MLSEKRIHSANDKYIFVRIQISYYSTHVSDSYKIGYCEPRFVTSPIEYHNENSTLNI